MNETYVTICGNVVAEPTQRSTQGGVPFTAFRVASTVRRRGRDGEFEDGPTSYYNVTAFRALGLNVASSVGKGEPVIVHGRQRVSQWQRDDGSYGTSVEIDASDVGHDLSRGATTFTRVSKPQSDPRDRLGDAAVQSAHEGLEEEGRRRSAVAGHGDPASDDYTVEPGPDGPDRPGPGALDPGAALPVT